ASSRRLDALNIRIDPVVSSQTQNKSRREDFEGIIAFDRAGDGDPIVGVQDRQSHLAPDDAGDGDVLVATPSDLHAARPDDTVHHVVAFFLEALPTLLDSSKEVVADNLVRLRIREVQAAEGGQKKNCYPFHAVNSFSWGLGL